MISPSTATKLLLPPLNVLILLTIFTMSPLNAGCPPLLCLQSFEKWKLIEKPNIDVTGPRDAKKAVIMIYDIFGPSPQALQGADRIRQHFDGCMVIMPDLFRGSALRYDQRAKALEFLAGPGAFKLNADAVRLDIVPAVRTLFPQFGDEGLGAFGLCWGGKIVVLAANADTTKRSPFAATGQAHPGGLDVADAKLLKTPHICLASKDENKDMVAGYATILADSSPDSVVETYANMFHGWMGTRANLDDEENRVEYEKGYRQVAKFFSKHL